MIQGTLTAMVTPLLADGRRFGGVRRHGERVIWTEVRDVALATSIRAAKLPQPVALAICYCGEADGAASCGQVRS